LKTSLLDKSIFYQHILLKEISERRSKMKTTNLSVRNVLPILAVLSFLLIPIFATTSHAKSAKDIDREVDIALTTFRQEFPSACQLLDSAKGVLVIPNEIKGGVLVGGEYGEGALRVHGKTVGYYNIAGGNFGLIAGLGQKNLILLFMQDGALERFRTSSNWTAGTDADITVMHNLDKEDYSNVFSTKEPVVAFAFGENGVIADLSIEGAKFSRMIKST